MLVDGLNKILSICRVVSNGINYTCPTKLINGELFFHLKKEWHKVAEFVTDNATELVEEGGKVFSRKFMK